MGQAKNVYKNGKVNEKVRKMPSEKSVPNLFSRVFFLWMVPIFYWGNRRDLDEFDLKPAKKKFNSKQTGDKLEKCWLLEEAAAKAAGRKPSYTKVLIRTFGWDFIPAGMVQFISIALRTISPLLFAQLLSYWSVDSTIDRATAAYYGLGMILCNWFAAFFAHHGNLLAQQFGMKLRVASSTLMFRKIMRLNNNSLGDTAAGKVVNILSNDMQRFDLAFLFMHYAWIIPLQLIAVCYLGYVQAGYAALVGFAALIIIALPIQAVMGRLLGLVRFRTADKTDERIKIMSEVISGIQVIKIYAWEIPFQKVVKDKRDAEMKWIKTATWLRTIFIGFLLFSERTALFIAILTFILLGNSMSANIIYPLQQFMSAAQVNITVILPLVISFTSELIVSLGRIQKFLDLEDRPDLLAAVSTQETGNLFGNMTSDLVINSDEKKIVRPLSYQLKSEIAITPISNDSKPNRGHGDETAVELRAVTASWTNDPNSCALKNVSLRVRKGKLCAVIGAVGSGKSSLLQLLLKELPTLSGQVSVEGSVSYACQEPWLFPSTVRDNILFGLPYDADKYRRTGKLLRTVPAVSSSYLLLKELPALSGQVSVDGSVSYACQEPWLFPSTVRDNILFGLPYDADKYRRVRRYCAGCQLKLPATKELPALSGQVSVHSSVSYACQEPWLFPSNVRDNILFGLPYDADKYRRVCRVCALEKDFKQFPFGDQTLVGERGVSMSGGQRARVNLARAVYREADIYLLDDPLSAVDANVGRQLFEGCISGYMRGRTRILVTHQIHFLKAADYIIVGILEAKIIIYLLDDPLSAVDANVGRQLFEGCISGYMRGRTRILVTHQIHFLKAADYIIVGTIEATINIYLLDDPLSAVDANVGRQLFEGCISGYMRGRTRILVTHQIHFLKAADYIIVGTIEATINIYLLDDPLSAVDANVGRQLFEAASGYMRGRTRILVTHQIHFLKAADIIVLNEESGTIEATINIYLLDDPLSAVDANVGRQLFEGCISGESGSLEGRPLPCSGTHETKINIYLLDDPLSAVDANVGRQLFEGCISGYMRGRTRILVTHQIHFLKAADYIIVGTLEAKINVYLLDDPLSAVDANVGRQLFEGCISGYMRGRTRILVTHQIHFLKAADYIIVLNEGTIENMGTFDELISTGKEFATMLNALGEGKDKDTESDTSGASHDSKKMLRVLSTVSTTGETGEKLEEFAAQKVAAEERSSGNLKWAVVSGYFRSGGNWCFVFFVVFMILMAAVSAGSVDYWISFWANEMARYEESLPAGQTIDPALDTQVGPFTTAQYLIIHSVLVLLTIILTQLRNVPFVNLCCSASKNLHNTMFSNMIKGIMRFFDTSSSGRILNRFTKDMGALDEILPRTLLDVLQIYSTLLLIIVLNAISLYLTLILSVVLLIIFGLFVKVYMKTAQGIKRLEGTTKSPVFGMVTSSLNGIATIRSCKAEERLVSDFDVHQDLHTAAWNGYLCGGSTFSLYLDTICVVYLAVIIYVFLYVDFGNAIAVGSVGLAVTQSNTLTNMLQHGARMLVEFVAQLTSVERVLEYTHIESEPNLYEGREYQQSTAGHIDQHAAARRQNAGGVLEYTHIESEPNLYEGREYQQPTAHCWTYRPTCCSTAPGCWWSSSEVPTPPTWPSSGRIVFQDVNMRYAPDLEPVLKNLNLVIESGWKVGIVGRTGAGKSSLISAMFRFAYIDGRITIDGLDTGLVSRQNLRSKISIIPQEPVLFSASMRYNLDPFDIYSDDDLWRALEQVDMKSAVPSLDFKVTEGGSNFSVGQRQLLCLARALLRSNKILIMDEATANVDPSTDNFIQQTIRRQFASCTVLTIAHRLNTIMDSDRVLVMSFGQVAEFDHPHHLLLDPDSAFSAMVRETGEKNAKVLAQAAKDAYFASHTHEPDGRTEQ
ncbi:ABC transporter domain-containing protein [Phthorimaea operculella]|nr:ABC transporter domain-containing protein [Phthorimaea operculella]